MRSARSVLVGSGRDNYARFDILQVELTGRHDGTLWIQDLARKGAAEFLGAYSEGRQH